MSYKNCYVNMTIKNPLKALILLYIQTIIDGFKGVVATKIGDSRGGATPSTRRFRNSVALTDFSRSFER
jgi:hypothetical protein